MPFLRLEACSPSENENAIKELRRENVALKARLNGLEKERASVSDAATLAFRLVKRIEELEKRLPPEKTGKND